MSVENETAARRLGNVVEAIFSGIVLSRQPQIASSGPPIRVINSRDIIEDGTLATTDLLENVNLPMTSQTERYRVQEGDVLVSARGVFKVGRVTGAHKGALAGPNLIVVRPGRILESWLVYSFLRHPGTRAELERHSVKTTVASIRIGTIDNLRIRVPHLSKQRGLARAVELAERQYALGRRIADARRLLGHQIATKDLII